MQPPILCRDPRGGAGPAALPVSQRPVRGRRGPADCRPAAPAEEEEAVSSGVAKYFRFTLDHKVVGIQYLIGMVIYFCTAGLFAMAIRA